MQKVLLSTLLFSFLPVLGGNTSPSAAAAYRAHVQTKIKEEELQKKKELQQAQCRDRADHRDCPHCLEYDAKMKRPNGLQLTDDQCSAIEELNRQFFRMPHELLWRSWRAVNSSTLPEGAVQGERVDQLALLQNRTPKVARSLSECSLPVFNLCIAYSQHCQKLNQKFWTEKINELLLQKLLPVPDLNAIIVDYLIAFPIGLTAGQATSLLMCADNGHIRLADGGITLDLSKSALCSAAGISSDHYSRLDLRGNHIAQIKKSDFNNSDFDVAVLDLSDNQISHIEDGALEAIFTQDYNTDCDRALNLQGNQMKCLTKAMMKVHSECQLARLDLSRNQISQIEEEALSQHKNLKTLDLSHNKLTYVPAELFSMERLERANLDGNPLTPTESQRYAELKAWLARPKSDTCTVS